MRRQSTLPIIAVVAAVALALTGAELQAAPQHGTGQQHGAPAQRVHPTPAPQPPPSAPVAAHGQRTHRPVTPTVPPFPNIATLSGPLPQGLLPPFAPPARDLFRAGPRSRGTSPYFFPAYAYGGYAETAPASNAALPPEPQLATGMLRFDVTPGSAQVFVDGLYSGTVDDIDRRRGLVLPEGPHRIELRAPGYSGDSIDVQVPAHDVVTYRGSLDLQRPPAPVTRAATTIYVIPGCYMGNVPPRPERVGAGCDVKNVRVVTPPAAPRETAAQER